VSARQQGAEYTEPIEPADACTLRVELPFGLIALYELKPPVVRPVRTTTDDLEPPW
jgi:hypothetical protein